MFHESNDRHNNIWVLSGSTIIAALATLLNENKIVLIVHITAIPSGEKNIKKYSLPQVEDKYISSLKCPSQ